MKNVKWRTRGIYSLPLQRLTLICYCVSAVFARRKSVQKEIHCQVNRQLCLNRKKTDISNYSLFRLIEASFTSAFREMFLCGHSSWNSLDFNCLRIFVWRNRIWTSIVQPSFRPEHPEVKVQTGCHWPVSIECRYNRDKETVEMGGSIT